jgi:hypothetical protein
MAGNLDLTQDQIILIATIVMAIATVTLAIITNKYAKITDKILEDQIKSRQISYIERRLEKLYYPLMDVLENPHTPYGRTKKEIGWQKTEKIIPFQYLSYDNSEEKIRNFFKYVMELKAQENLSFENIENHDIIDVIRGDITNYIIELNELINK